MKYDKPILAILIVQIVLIPIEIFTQVMKYYNLTTVSALEAMSMMWIPEGSMVVGLAAGFGIGSWAGIITYYSARILGTDYFPFKSMLLAMTIEAAIFSVYGVLGRNIYLMQNTSGNMVHTFAAAVGGLLTGYFIKKYLLK